MAITPKTLSLVALLAPALLLWAAAVPADTPTAPAQLRDVTVTTQADSVTVAIKLSGSARYEADLIDSPNRLVVDLQDTSYGWRKAPLGVNLGPLKEIRGSQYRKGVTRLVLELTRRVGYAIREEDDGLAIVIPTSSQSAPSDTAVAPKRDVQPPTVAAAKPATKPAAVPAPRAEMAASSAVKPTAIDKSTASKTDAVTTEIASKDGTPAGAMAKTDPTPTTASKTEVPAPVTPESTAMAAPAAKLETAAPIVPKPATAASTATLRRDPLVLAQAQPAPGSTATPAAGNGRLISLDFKDADVVNLLRILAAESDKNIVISEDVKGKMSISLRNVPWQLALDTILEAKSLQKVERDNVIRIVSTEQLAKEREARARVEEAKLKSEADVRTKVAEAQIKEQEVQQRKLAAEAAAAEAAARGPLREETIRLSYADPEEIAKTLQGILGIPAEGVQAASTPIPVGPPPIAEQPFAALYGPAAQPPAPRVMSPSADVLAKGITIRAHKPTNSLFIRHYANDLERIKQLIREKLDIPLPQVKIEARMEILDREDLFALGVQWGGGGVVATGSQATVVGRGFTTGQTSTGGTAVAGLAAQNPNLTLTGGLPVSATTGLPAGGNIVNLPIGSLLGGAAAAGTGGLAFGIVGTKLNINLALEALRTQGKTATLARPEVVTVENNKATISLGEEIPYATVSSAGTQIQFKEALLKLEVIPTVIREAEGNKIKMRVVVENNSRSTTTVDLGSAGSPPVINRRKAETEVLIKEGERLVIGGVTTNVATDAVRKVPLFGDIPVLGWLFKQTGNQETRRELVLFLTPSILRATSATVPVTPERPRSP